MALLVGKGLTSVRNFLIIINSLFLEVAGVENLGTDYFYVEQKGTLMFHFLVWLLGFFGV